jgi:2-oxoglutarate dehydrogenase E2 component (dihydrolipoamide succinyltransferase)
MPATIDELATDLQQFFAERFPLDGDDGPGSVLLVFDNLGRPLSPKEFTGSGTDAATDLLSHQRAADLADQLPAGNALKRGWYLPRGGSRLSRWYASVLRGSSGPAPAAGEAQLQAFEAAKAAALRELDLNQLVMVSGTGPGGSAGTVAAAGTFDTYYATSMSPLDWFSDDSTSWNTYQVAASDEPRATTAPAGPVAAPAFTFMVAQDPQVPEIVQYVQYATVTEPTAPDQPDPNWALLQDDSLRLTLGTQPSIPGQDAVDVAVPGELVSPIAVNRSVAARTLSVADVSRPDPLADLASTAALDLVGTSKFVALSQTEQAFDVMAAASVNSHVDAALASQAGAPAVVDATVSTPATSNGFAVRFEYCLVRLDRPWWDDIFLHRHDWRLPGYEAGQISSGSAADPAGEITLITIGMLVIRDLTITANWSAADLAALPRSTSLGPFCIAAGGFDRTTGTLTRKGMQAAAWLCLVPPRMPAA